MSFGNGGCGGAHIQVEDQRPIYLYVVYTLGCAWHTTVARAPPARARRAQVAVMKLNFEGVMWRPYFLSCDLIELVLPAQMYI